MKTCRYSSELIIATCAVLFFIFLSFLSVAGAEMPRNDLDFSDAAVKRGKELFTSICRNCHSLKYLGYEAAITAAAARSAFGEVPPDLSLMAKARGRSSDGAGYIYSLLTHYTDTPEKNSVFPNITMPPPFSRSDPEFTRKAKDVSVFLDDAAEPSQRERRELGRYVLGYMTVFVALLYALNRRVWKRIGKNSSNNDRSE